jgi:hypothetical protein
MPHPDSPAFTEAELGDIEKWAKQDLMAGNLGQQANARRLLRLVEEVRWHRVLFARLYHAIPDVPGTEDPQAELGREAFRLGVIKPGSPTFTEGRGRGLPGRLIPRLRLRRRYSTRKCITRRGLLR